MIPDERRFRAISITDAAFVGDYALIASSELDSAAAIETSMFRALQYCEGYRNIEEHARAIAQGTLAGIRNGRRLAATLAECGFLRPEETRCGEQSDVASSSPGISTVVVFTRNSPELLARCLDSFCANVAVRNRAPRILVLDSSSDASAVARGMEIVQSLRRSYQNDVIFVDASEKSRIRERLIANGAASVVTDFGLVESVPGSSTGASRNFALLLTAGENILMLDDDVICAPRRLQNSSEDSVVFGGHEDPRVIRFFETRAAAVASSHPSTTDLLSAHERVLGWHIGALFAKHPGQAEARGACPDLLMAGNGRTGARVRWSITGIVGDAAIYCPFKRLFRKRQGIEQFVESQNVFDIALSSREVVHVAERPVITHGSFCMTYALGIDNRTTVPPFMPLWRNQDGVFGLTWQASSTNVFTAHVPLAVIHDSRRPSKYESSQIRSASELRMAEVITALSAVPRPLGSELEIGLARIGEVLESTASQSIDEFAASVLAATLRANANEYAAFARTAESYPRYVRRAAAEHERVFIESVQRPMFRVPVEYRSGNSLAAGLRCAQLFVQKMGALYRAWCQTWRVAAAMNREGQLQHSVFE
jgi:hypothetical protein